MATTIAERILEATRKGRSRVRLGRSGTTPESPGKGKATGAGRGLLSSSHFQIPKPQAPVSKRKPKDTDVQVTPELIREVATRIASCFRHPRVMHCQEVAGEVLSLQHGRTDLIGHLVGCIEKGIEAQGGCRRRRGVTRLAKRAMRLLLREALSLFRASELLASSDRDREVHRLYDDIYMVRIGRRLHAIYSTRKHLPTLASPCPHCGVQRVPRSSIAA